MSSVIEKLYADLEKAQAKAALLDKFTADFIRGLELEDTMPEEIEDLIKNDAIVPKFKKWMLESIQLRSIHKLFPCSKCGQPLAWGADGELAKHLQHYYSQKSWYHTKCPEKKEKNKEA